MQWVFETLGIDKQASVSTVRKAYAKAIKQCDQATEADRFQHIRHAYEVALQWATQREAAAPAVPATSSGDTHAERPTVAKPPVAQELAAPKIIIQPLTPPLTLVPSSTARPPYAPRLNRLPYTKPGGTPPIGPASALSQRSARAIPPTDETRAPAKAVLDELLIEARRPNVVSVAAVLTRYANDDRLTSLDAKAEFEHVLLVYIFAGPVDVSMLDAACDLFAWEASNRHLGMRPDLVQRLLRQQMLRRLLAGEADKELHWALRIYTTVQQQPQIRVEPWEILKANRLLDRFGSFKQELGERYNAAAFEWWRQKLMGNPTLLASYQENKPAQQLPPGTRKRQPQRTARKFGGGLLWLWPILCILGAIAGHIPSNGPSYQPYTYTASTPVSDQPATTTAVPAVPAAPPPPPASFANNPYLMPVDALVRAAERGDPEAQNYLGIRYESGDGIAQNTQKAAYWFRQAAEQGFPESQFRLGELYAQGNGVPQDARLAAEWWQQAATQGNVLAQSSLAEAYAKGDGVKQDYRAARLWWQKAEFDTPRAQAGLGWLEENGYGVPRDAKAAVDWYRKAAARGDVTGQVDLALMYERGEGVPADPVVATALLTVATEHQDPHARGAEGRKDLDRISAALTPDQHAAASQIARDLSSSPYNFLATLDQAIRSRHPK
jgi:TPR repeat protein